MVVKSKFNIGDKAYYWSTSEVKVLYGVIEYIHVSVSEKRTRISYGLKRAGERFGVITESTPEHLVFENREDVFEFCMELTKDI